MSRLWDAEVALTPEGARAAVTAHYREFEASVVVAVGEGWDNFAFLFDGVVLFRFPRRSIAVELLRREIVLLPRFAAALPLRVPVPRYSGTWRGSLAWPFAGYDMLAGDAASIRAHSDAERVLLAEPLARFLAALHAVPTAQLTMTGLSEDPLARFDASRWTPQALQRARNIAKRGLRIPPQLLAWFGSHVPEPGARVALVHGDLYARHILLGKDRSPTGIIDWGDMHLGYPALDLAVAHTMLPPSAHDAFRGAYGPIDEGAWLAARWRGIYSGLLCLEYGIEANVEDMRRCGAAALELIARSIEPPLAPGSANA